ncbi:MAG: flagellar hook-basal body complex protein FliE [Planctomycetota bacterium]
MSDPLGLINPNQGVSPLQPGKPLAQPQVEGPGFKDVLMKNLEQVSQLQKDAETAFEDFATGDRSDVNGVMAAKAKADVAFQMLMQVRNKMMDAYEEVKQIRV